MSSEVPPIPPKPSLPSLAGPPDDRFTNTVADAAKYEEWRRRNTPFASNCENCDDEGCSLCVRGNGSRRRRGGSHTELLLCVVIIAFVVIIIVAAYWPSKPVPPAVVQMGAGGESTGEVLIETIAVGGITGADARACRGG